MADPVKRRGIAPVNVLEPEHQGYVRRDRFDRKRKFAHHALARLPSPRLQRAAFGARPQRRHLRKPTRRLAREDRLHGQPVRRAGKPCQCLDQWQIRLANAMMLEALAERDPDAVSAPQSLYKGVEERALADAGVAGHEHHLAAARAHCVEGTRKFGQLGVPPDHPRWFGRARRRLRAVVWIGDRVGRQHEAVTAPVAGLDNARPSGIVAEGASKLLDARRKRVVADRHAAPDAV